MASTTRLTPESLKQQLVTYEERYGLTSTDFLEKYHAGKMGDARDVMRWAWLCTVAVKLGMLAARKPETPMSA
jgi:hypothetical protein